MAIKAYRPTCRHCGASFPESIPHDRIDGRACRPSGQLSEREIKAKLHKKALADLAESEAICQIWKV